VAASSLLQATSCRSRVGGRQASPRNSKERKPSYPETCRTGELRRFGMASVPSNQRHSQLRLLPTKGKWRRQAFSSSSGTPSILTSRYRSTNGFIFGASSSSLMSGRLLAAASGGQQRGHQPLGGNPDIVF